MEDIWTTQFLYNLLRLKIEDFQYQAFIIPNKSKKYKSYETLLQEMPSTHHVEIGGEVFFQPFKQFENRIHVENE